VIGALILIGVVAVIAFALRAAGGRSDEAVSVAPVVHDDDDDDDDTALAADDESDERDHEVAPGATVPVTSEGIAFIRDSHGLRLLRLVEPGSDFPDWLQNAVDESSVAYGLLNRLYFPAGSGATMVTKPGYPLDVGDLTGARLVPGVAGEYAWRLETLGRDGDFGFYPFTTRAGAEAALEMLEDHGIVQRPTDENDQPIPPSREDFEEARRRYEETETALAIDSDEEGELPPPEAPWTSDRR
jgi:hypothetical protein